jgi:enamine deaminase RidA (YjgF/YER057c/UK114 family)
VGKDLTTQEAQLAARDIGLSILANLKAEIGELGRIAGWMRVFGMVNSASGYDQQHVVMNGFSDLIIDVFGADIGRHARSAIGVSGLPMNFAIEIEAEVLVSNG